jgi:hypothetical protein
MSNNLALYSKDPIGSEEFFEFLVEIGGVAKPDQFIDGRLSRDQRHLWLFNSLEALEESLEDIGAELTKALGGEPRGCIVIELSRAPGSERLALDFSIAFAERWHAVLCDPWDRLRTLDDMRRALRDGESLGVGA